jgi:hypothetical protein
MCPLGAYQNTQNKKYNGYYFVNFWHNWNTFVLFSPLLTVFYNVNDTNNNYYGK